MGRWECEDVEVVELCVCVYVDGVDGREGGVWMEGRERGRVVDA